MIKNFILLAFRNFYKHKLFVLINILGLGTALGCCIVAYLNNKFEADFNKNFLNRDKIYKVNVVRQINDREQKYSISPISLAPLIRNDIAGIESVVRYIPTQVTLKYGNEADSKVFNIRSGFADKDFFNMFNFPVKSGSTDQFTDKGNIVITEETAQKYFGDTDPIGKSFTAFDEKGLPVNFNIIAVIREIPLNSMVIADAFTLFDNYLSLFGVDEFNWLYWTGATFLTIPNNQDVPRIEQQLANYIDIQNKAKSDWLITRFEVQTLKQFTKESRDIWSNWLNQNLHPAQRNAPAIMAILILLLACFNFMNTSVSVANTRTKEIGIRKVVGAKRSNLIVQYLGENAIICLFALLVSLLFASYLTEEYNKMWPYMKLTMDFSSNIGFWLFLLLLLVVTTVAAGAYPSFYLSSFNPVKVLRGIFRFKGAGVFSKVLLGLQLMISLIALISGIIFTQNATYQEKFDMGYQKDNLIVVPLARNVSPESLSAVCKSHPDILSVAFTSNHIGWGGYTRTAEFEDKKNEVRVMDTNVEYDKTMGLKFTEGRGFAPEFEKTDVFRSAVVNELFIEEMGIKDPINKVIRIDSLNLKIVGVVRNFYMSLWEKLTPIVFITRGPESRGIMVVNTYTDKKKEVMEFVKKEWEKLVPNSPFNGLEQVMVDEDAQTVNKNIKNINLFLALTAIILSLIALYTLVSLNIIRRTKEIGVRTVLGSGGFNIFLLISKPFITILIISSILGSAAGYFLNSMMLKSLWYYHSSIGVASIAVPVILLFILSLIILGSRVYLTLMRNPVESLRYE